MNLKLLLASCGEGGSDGGFQNNNSLRMMVILEEGL